MTALVVAAPQLTRWRITAFRPRCHPLNLIQIGDISVDPATVQFSLLTRGSEIGLLVFIPAYTESSSILKQVGYLMLDEALGEYDMETRVSLIQFLPPESPRSERRYPFPELPTMFDRLVAQLDGPKANVTH